MIARQAPVPGWPPRWQYCAVTLTPVQQEDDAARASSSEKNHVQYYTDSKLPLFTLTY